jgi:hypothetical protein
MTRLLSPHRCSVSPPVGGVASVTLLPSLVLTGAPPVQSTPERRKASNTYCRLMICCGSYGLLDPSGQPGPISVVGRAGRSSQYPHMEDRASSECRCAWRHVCAVGGRVRRGLGPWLRDSASRAIRRCRSSLGRCSRRRAAGLADRDQGRRGSSQSDPACRTRGMSAHRRTAADTYIHATRCSSDAPTPGR